MSWQCGLVAGIDGVLIDVYNTALACDFEAHRKQFPMVVGVAEDVWFDACLVLVVW